MSNPTIYPLFSTPVYVNNVGEFERPDLSALEYAASGPPESAYGFLSSTDRRVLDRPEFGRVRSIVMQEVNRYAKNLLAVSDKIEFYITNSWINVYRPGQLAGPHAHGNSLISGVLYLKVADSGAIVFHRDVNSLIPFPQTIDLDIASFNIYNCKSWGHMPKTNDICLFPSALMHSVQPNQSDQERWCLPFNCFVRGSFGGSHELTLR